MKQLLNPLYKKIVVKVGTNVITAKNGELDLEILQQLTAQIAELYKQGIQIILVSSGAVGAGRRHPGRDEAVEEAGRNRGGGDPVAAVSPASAPAAAASAARPGRHPAVPRPSSCRVPPRPRHWRRWSSA